MKNIEDVNIKEGSLPSIQPGKVTPKKRMSGLLRLLAAVLVCVVLIGSLALVLNTARGKSPATNAGNKHGVTPTATRSLNCVNTTDLAEQALCTSGQETILNLPVTIDKDQITFVRAYADAQRVILIYSAPEALPLDVLFRGLETRQGDLGGDPVIPIHLKTSLYEIDFMGNVLAGNVTQLQVQGITMLGPISPDSIPLQFTLPVHTGRQVASINQTRTTDGISLTVKSVVITAATTTFTIIFSPLLTMFETSTSPTFILAGQTFAWHSYQEDGASGQEQTFALDLAGLVHSGTNTLQVQAGTSNTGAMTPTTAPLTTHTWNFQFTV